METSKPPASKEISLGPVSVKASPPRQPPRAAPASPGVLHLGKVNKESCTELEAVRIVVPRTAIVRSCRVAGHTDNKTDEKGSPHHGVDERPPYPPSEPPDYKSLVEKLQNAERRLLQDKEGLSNQLHVQTEVGTICPLITDHGCPDLCRTVSEPPCTFMCR